MKVTTSFLQTSRAFLALSLLLCVAVMASAQTLRVTADQTNLRDKPSVAGAVVAGQPASPAPSSMQASSSSEPSFGFRGFGTVAIDQQNASESFKAVAESATTTSFGGGLQLTNVWAGLFIEVGVERTAVDGERVFVDDAGAVHRVGIPVKITMMPIDVLAGWRFGRSGRVIPYAAAGFTSLAYEETSDFASGDENVKERAQGAVIAGGVEVRLIRWLHVRGEARYRHVPGILGEFGVSKEFEEKTLGGFGGAVKIVVGR